MAEEHAERTMHIGELAERSELSLRTIRHYDEVGLLPPSGRTHGGFRIYTEEDFRKLMVIRRMKTLGFSLEEMAELLTIREKLRNATDESERSDVATRLESLAADARTRRQRLERDLARADEFISILDSMQRKAGHTGE